MSTDRDHLSLPRLYGAPAHSPRRVAAADPVEPPVGADDLPIEISRSEEDQALALQLFPRAYTSRVIEGNVRPFRTAGAVSRRPPQLNGRPLLLRALGGRLMRPKGH